jgi:hypothetical protein
MASGASARPSAARHVWRICAGLLFVPGVLACPSGKPASSPNAAPSASIDVPLGEVTLQAALEAAWDGEFQLCYKRARTAMKIAPDDLETMELTMRCAHAHRTLHEATTWVRGAYAKRLNAPVVRFGLGVAALLRGEIGEARKTLDKVENEAPTAAFHAALAAQLDDDVIAAEKHIALYAKANPSEPAGRALQTEIVCALDLTKCSALLETVHSTDDDETAIARRVGAVVAGAAVVTRARLAVLTRDAEALQSAAYGDALAVATLLREGADPAMILVRSPRSGRPEPAPGVDLVKQARPIPRLPFATRVVQLASLNDPAATIAHSRMAALFPTEFATWRLAKRWERTAHSARKELERAPFTRWRAMVATTLARPDELCELSQGFPWTDRGPVANSTRARCEISLDPARGRKIAEARLAVQPFGHLDVETAIDGHAAMKDTTALEALGRSMSKTAAATMLPALALWAAADAGAKKSHALFAEAVALSGWDPLFSRRLLQRYVDTHDVTRAKTIIPEALFEAPNDAFLCGVFGEILLHEGKAPEALPWLTKSCVSARARKEQDILGNTLASLASAVARAKALKDKPARDAAVKCAKGE